MKVRQVIAILNKHVILGSCPFFSPRKFQFQKRKGKIGLKKKKNEGKGKGRAIGN